MPQDSATLQAPPQLFALTNGGTTTSTVQLVADAKAVWSDAATDTFTPGTTAVVSAYDASPTIDTSAFVWLVFLIKGAAPLLVKEIDFPANIETVLSAATWMPFARIDGPTLSPYHPAPGTGLPPGVATGDTLYFVSGTGPGTGWVILPIS